MNKKISIVAIVMLVVGIIGTTWSLLYATPSINDYANEKRKQANQEYNIFEERADINNLEINSDVADIEIKHHNKNTVLIARKGMTDNLDYKISQNDKTLLIEEEQSNNNSRNFKNIDSMLKSFLDEIFTMQDHSIVVYLPNRVDLKLVTGYGRVEIKDDIFLNEFTLISTNDIGGFSFSKEIQNLQNLNLMSSNYISFNVTDIIGIKNVRLSSPSVNITSNDDEFVIDDIESKLPENLTIMESDLGERQTGEVYINSKVPIAKNLNIEAKNSLLDLSLPTEKYKFNYNIHSEQKNNIKNPDFIEYDENGDEIQEEKIDIDGIVNKALEKLEVQYNVKANIGYYKK